MYHININHSLITSLDEEHSLQFCFSINSSNIADTSMHCSTSYLSYHIIHIYITHYMIVHIMSTRTIIANMIWLIYDKIWSYDTKWYDYRRQFIIYRPQDILIWPIWYDMTWQYLVFNSRWRVCLWMIQKYSMSYISYHIPTGQGGRGPTGADVNLRKNHKNSKCLQLMSK